MPAVAGQVLPMGSAPELAPAARPPAITPEPTTLSSALITVSPSEAYTFQYRSWEPASAKAPPMLLMVSVPVKAAPAVVPPVCATAPE